MCTFPCSCWIFTFKHRTFGTWTKQVHVVCMEWSCRFRIFFRSGYCVRISWNFPSPGNNILKIWAAVDDNASNEFLLEIVVLSVLLEILANRKLFSRFLQLYSLVTRMSLNVTESQDDYLWLVMSLNITQSYDDYLWWAMTTVTLIALINVVCFIVGGDQNELACLW